ncbi:MAG: HesA/MoeB/ThiF family protein [Ostreibacterium sp.]
MDDKELLLYSRQMLVGQWGVETQEKIRDKKVLIVGAGGLGCSVAQYLAGSGVGGLIIIDGDIVDWSNLPRQILFSAEDVGKPKATRLAEIIMNRLPTTTCTAKNSLFSDELMQNLMAEDTIDLVIDAGDNLALSYQLDHLVKRYQLPLVHASVSRFEGHCYVRLPEDNFPALKTLFPQPSVTESCSQAGVLTVAVGLIASYQATQAIRVLVSPCLGEIKPELIFFDGMTMRLMSISLAQNAVKC